MTATYGSALPKITKPAKTGYEFGGYFLPDGTQYYKADGTGARNWDRTSDTKLYAKWTAASYKVTLDLQGGSGGTTNVTATYGSALPPITVPVKKGYMFGGYYALDGTQYYKKNGESAHAWDRTSDTKLFAKWMPKTQESPVGVSCQWLEENASGIVAANGGDYEAAAKALAANGQPVWECYVADISPTDPAAHFAATLAWDGSQWCVRPDPDRSPSRVYEVEGTDCLGPDTSWGPANAASRFFRVRVRLPE